MPRFRFTLILVLMGTLTHAKDSIQFNTQGEVIPPDEVHLAKGLEHEQDGFPNAAIKSFTKASEYGNEHARFFNGLLHLQQGNNTDALAWLYLLNAEKINRVDKVMQLKRSAMAQLTDAQLLEAEAILLALEKNHNPHQARIKRALWRDGLQFSGTHLKGNVVGGTKVYANTHITLGPFGEIEYMRATPVSSFKLRQELEEFVVNYRYDLPNGQVELHDIETED